MAARAKKKMDLYDTLGVDRDANAVEVQKAFRKKALASHPDCGGERENFEIVKIARDVLCDAERRERYDRTGEYEEVLEPDNRQAELYKVLSTAFGAIVELAVEDGRMISEIDVVNEMGRLLFEAKGEFEQKMRLLTTKRARHNECRIKVKNTLGRFNLEESAGRMLELIAKNHLVLLEREIAETDKEIRQLDEAYGFLKLCRYKVDTWAKTKMQTPAQENDWTNVAPPWADGFTTSKDEGDDE